MVMTTKYSSDPVDAPKFMSSCSWWLGVFPNVAWFKVSQQWYVCWKLGLRFLLFPRRKIPGRGILGEGCQPCFKALAMNMMKLSERSFRSVWMCAHDHTLGQYWGSHDWSLLIWCTECHCDFSLHFFDMISLPLVYECLVIAICVGSFLHSSLFLTLDSHQSWGLLTPSASKCLTALPSVSPPCPFRSILCIQSDRRGRSDGDPCGLSLMSAPHCSHGLSFGSCFVLPNFKALDHGVTTVRNVIPFLFLELASYLSNLTCSGGLPQPRRPDQAFLLDLSLLPLCCSHHTYNRLLLVSC